MKLQNTAVNSLLYLLYMFGGCIAVMVVETLFVFIISKFVVLSYPALTIIRLTLYALGVPAIMTGVGYIEGYREASPDVAETVVGGVVAMVFHLLLALLFKFEAFVSGGVRFAAGLIRHGMGITDELLTSETPTDLFLAMFVLFGAVYITVLTVARCVGAKRRIISRAELRESEEA